MDGPADAVEVRVEIPRSVHRHLRIIAAEQEQTLAGLLRDLTTSAAAARFPGDYPAPERSASAGG